jgi:hypothetical protein
MNKLLYVVLLPIVISACWWPRPSYKGLDPRCREWNINVHNAFRDRVLDREYVLRLGVFDRYQYYICINSINSLDYRDPYIFLDTLDAFFELIVNEVHANMDALHLFLIARMVRDMAEVNPQAVKKHTSVIDSFESAAAVSRDVYFRELALREIQITKLLAR